MNYLLAINISLQIGLVNYNVNNINLASDGTSLRESIKYVYTEYFDNGVKKKE